MQKYNIYLSLFFLAILSLFINISFGQDNIPINKIIKVKKDLLCQIDFTTTFEANISMPKNSEDYYIINNRTNGGRSLTIITKQENPPRTLLTVTEANGKIYNITVEYKADLDEETETYYNYSDKKKAVRKNTILTETDSKFPSVNKQDKPNPYPIDELGQLRKTYPGIDFTQPPPEQLFNRAFEKDITVIDRLYTNKRAEIIKAFKNDLVSVRIICQEIRFNGANAYLKLLLQNDGTEDFLTGSMLLTLVRPNGALLSLYPGYIYPEIFPILKPKYKIEIIYSFKAFHIADEEDLKFEIQDRQQKINLEFNLKGVDYNEARKD